MNRRKIPFAWRPEAAEMVRLGLDGSSLSPAELRRMREDCGYSQETFGHLLGISRGGYNVCETRDGIVEPSRAALARIIHERKTDPAIAFVEPEDGQRFHTDDERRG